MIRFSPRQRDLISVILLVLILLLAFPLLGAWFSDRAPVAHPSTPTVEPTPTEESSVTFSIALHQNTGVSQIHLQRYLEWKS